MNERLEKLRESGAPERRAISVSDFEIRADGDSLSMEGHATVFDAPYDMYGGPDKGGWSEVVDRKAFAKTLADKPDVHLLINHQGMPLARTKSGTLKLSTDSTGLHVSAPNLDRRDPDVQRLEVKMDRGDMDEMSFAFRTIADEFNEDAAQRRLTELSLHKGDVSVVNFGANPATSAKIRSLLDSLTDVDEDELVEQLRSFDGDLDAAYRTLGRVVRALKPDEARALTLTEIRNTYFDL